MGVLLLLFNTHAHTDTISMAGVASLPLSSTSSSSSSSSSSSAPVPVPIATRAGLTKILRPTSTGYYCWLYVYPQNTRNASINSVGCEKTLCESEIKQLPTYLKDIYSVFKLECSVSGMVHFSLICVDDKCTSQTKQYCFLTAQYNTTKTKLSCKNESGGSSCHLVNHYVV